MGLGFAHSRRASLTWALPGSRRVGQDQTVELNELDWNEMLKFGGVALLALIVLARLMMRG